MCTGLVTVALFFGSTKNTRTFFPFAPACFDCAPAKALKAVTITRTGSTSCVLSFICDLLSRCHCSRSVPAAGSDWGRTRVGLGSDPSLTPSAAAQDVEPAATAFPQPACRRLVD